MIRYIEFVLRYRIPVVVILLLLTAFFGYQLSLAKINSSPGELFFGDNSLYRHYLERTAEFGSDVIVLIAYEEEDVLAPESLRRLKAVVDELTENDEIHRVESLMNAQHIRSAGDTLEIDKYADLFIDEPDRKADLLHELNTDNLTRDWLVTPDGRHAIVVVEFTAGDRSAEEAPRTMEFILGAFDRHGFEARELHRGGLVAVMAEMLRQSLFSLKTILPVTAAVLFLSVFIMFRRFWPVLLTGVITAMAIVWTMGLAVLLYGHINIFTTMIPALILITCFADVLHLSSAYLLELALGYGKDEAIRRIGKEVGTACGYTSLTTLCGFLALAMVPSPVFRQTGLLMGFGVSAALFTALTLVPICLYWLPEPKPWRKGSTGALQTFLDRVLDCVAKITLGRPRSMVALFLIFFIAVGTGMALVNFETQFSKRFIETNPIRVGVRYFVDQFHGAYPLDIYLEAQEPDALLDPVLFKKIAEFEDWLQERPQIHEVVSIVDLVKKLYREINPDMAAENPLPPTRQALAQLLLIFEMSGGEDLDRIIDRPYQTTRLNARLPEIGVIETANLGREIVAHAKTHFGSVVKAEALSMDYLMGDWVDEIINGQRRGLAFALATIAVLMVIATRSIRIGLLAMIPNILPLMALLGYLGWFWDAVDTDTMAILMVAVGIGVDDTIHFMMRLRFESQKTDNLETAVQRTLHYSGRAIIITTVILVAGFYPFSWSDYFTVKIFGTLLPFSLIVALAADLLLVPAFVKLGWLRFKVLPHPEEA